MPTVSVSKRTVTLVAAASRGVLWSGSQSRLEFPNTDELKFSAWV